MAEGPWFFCLKHHTVERLPWSFHLDEQQDSGARLRVIGRNPARLNLGASTCLPDAPLTS